MSAVVGVEQSIETVTTDVNADDLWHLAADDHEDRLADTGRPWRTLCGIIRPPTTRPATPAYFLAPMEKCAVCASIFGTAS